YDNLRGAQYTPESSFRGNVDDFEDYIGAAAYDNPPAGSIVFPGNGWSWRQFKNGCKRLAKDRVSLNVVGDKKMIQELDRLMLKGEFIDKNGRLVKLSDSAFTKGY